MFDVVCVCVIRISRMVLIVEKESREAPPMAGPRRCVEKRGQEGGGNGWTVVWKRRGA